MGICVMHFCVMYMSERAQKNLVVSLICRSGGAWFQAEVQGAAALRALCGGEERHNQVTLLSHFFS